MKRDYGAALGINMLSGERPARQYHGEFNQQQNNSYSATYNSFNKGKQIMSFQNYVRSLSNSVDENTACKKYKDFMANLSQSKVGRFFDANKDREWFRLKYHPIDSQKYLHQQNVSFLKRLNMFNELNERNYFDTLPYSTANKSAILNLMDAIIVHLEDGPKQLVDQFLSRDDTKIDLDLRLKYIPNRPTSILLDDISIETTIADVQEICMKASPDLLRIAQLDPYYIEEGLMRRKIIAIYANHVDIKDVCWKLSRMKLNNRSIVASINKNITNRVLAVDPRSNHHLCIINDIRNAIVIILNFDELKGLFGKRKQILENVKQETNNATVEVKMEVSSQDDNVDSLNNVAPLSPPGSEKSANEDDEGKLLDISSLDEDKEKERKKLFEFKFSTDPSLYRQVSKLSKSKNPIFEKAYLYLVEYINRPSVIQYQLSRVPEDLIDTSCKEELTRQEQDKFDTLQMILDNLPHSVEESTKYLDKLLWYLRIVHSFDYYSKSLYRQEDELTLRMAVIHVREHLTELSDEPDFSAIQEYLEKTDREFREFGQSQVQNYVTKDEERYNYKSYGKVITDELTSYVQKIQKPKSTETEEVYKCRHCTRVFQKLTDIGRHFVSKHRWAIDAIELETDFFNSYLFDPNKINPCPPKELLEVPPNRFAKITNFSQMGEDPDLLQQTLEAYSKMESFVREPAPRAQVESDPRNNSIVDYTDISFDDAI